MPDTLDLTTLSEEPVESNVQVEITDAPEETVADEGPVEEPVVDEEPVETAGPEETTEETTDAPEEPVEEVAPEEPEAPAEAPVEEEPVEEVPVEEVASEEPVETAGPVEEASAAPVEQVAADIRNILTEVPTVSEGNEENVESVDDSSGLSDDLKQRIAELEYLRECCGEWISLGRRGKSNFLTSWENKSVTVDSSKDYVNVLVQLEKLPEIIKLWAERKVTTNSNHFKNIESYNLTKSLFNEKSNGEKVEVLEQLITLLTDCANGKMRTNQIEEFIDNLY